MLVYLGNLSHTIGRQRTAEPIPKRKIQAIVAVEFLMVQIMIHRWVQPPTITAAAEPAGTKSEPSPAYRRRLVRDYR